MATSVNVEVQQLTERIKFGRSLLDKAHVFKTRNKIEGMQRIEKQIKAELTMLEKLISGTQTIREHHVNSTNFIHLEGVLHVCEHVPMVTGVERFYQYTDERGGLHSSIMVDVVCNDGSIWIKLFARKRKALHRKWLGDCGYNEKSVSDFADDYMSASAQNHHNFRQPLVVFIFFDGITESISSELLMKDIEVVGPVYADESLEEAPSPLQIVSMFRNSIAAQPLSLPFDATTNSCPLINMDISTMLAWISSITRHPVTSELQFNDPILMEQVTDELKEPLWPKLQATTEGKSLIACRTAVTDFKSIVSVVAGPTEKERAEELLGHVSIVDDMPSERAKGLTCSGKIKERSKIIFGTGDKLQAVTLSANEGFVRAAAGKGVHFNVIIHSCRALAEMDYRHTMKKETRPIDQSSTT